MNKGRSLVAAAMAATLCVVAVPALADTLAQALASAYMDNSQLNAARAELRGIDENVPQALSGYRPTVSATGDAGVQDSRSALNPGWGQPTYPRGVTLTIEQPIFRGWQTTNSVKVAKLSVLAARQQLLNIEQQVLLDAVQAFMGVVEAQVILNLRAQNVQFLREQVRAATDRLNVGEGTRTDVAQTNSSLAQGMSAYAAAAASLNSAVATYEQVIGHKPNALGSSNHIDRLVPTSQEVAVTMGLAQHPQVLAATYNIDVASYNVKILEGAMLPTVGLQAQVQHRDGLGSNLSDWQDTAGITGQINIPIYSGGQPSSRVRQAKETLGQRRIDLDTARAQVKQAAISAFGTLDAARAQVRATASEVSAQQLVLSGVIEERKVGQRTTLDVLNAQQELLTAEESQVVAQHDRVVAAYTLIAAIGKLTARDLGLGVPIYDPTEHYDAVKDKWGGLRTPDGR